MFEKVKLREKLGFGFGIFGQNLIYGLLTGYLLIYYTDVALLPLAVTATLFTTARLWDAVNDPMMGVLADRTRTKWGRFRPYLLFASIPIAILSVLVFSVPEISMTGKIVFAFVTYILWGMAYTLADIPMWSMTSVITKDSNEKTSIISLISIFSFIGVIGISVAAVPLLEAFGGIGSASAYRTVAIIMAVICAAGMITMFFTTKERVKPENRTVTLKESFGALIKNKPLMLIIVSFIVTNSIMAITQAITVFFAEYNLGNAELVPLITMSMFIPLLIGTGLTGLVSKRIGKKKTLIFSSLLRAVSLLALYFTGFTNLTTVLVFNAISGFFLAFPLVLLTSMISDCVVFSEWKTGIRGDGLSFSMRTFMAKLASAIGGGLSAVLLAAYGYVSSQPVTEFTQAGIFNMMSLFPAIAAFVGIIPIFFYTLTQEKVEKMTLEIEERKANG